MDNSAINDPSIEADHLQTKQRLQLESLLNIMERGLYELSESADTGATPQRIDDLRALVTSMKGIVQEI